MLVKPGRGHQLCEQVQQLDGGQKQLGAAVGGRAAQVVDQGLLVEAAQAFLFLNGFNMLPLLPLDGGHVLEALFLVRRPKLEVAIRLLAVLGLGALALLLKSGAFGLLTFLQIGSLRASYTVAHRAAEFGRELESSGATPDMNAIPPEYLERMTPDLWSIAKNSVNPARLAASWARVVWRKACQRRPGVPATVALSLLYFFMLAIGLVSPFAMAVLDQGAQLDVTIEDRASPLGSMIPVEIRRAQGVKVLECPLDAQGFYDGISYERAAVTGAPLVVTGWRQGVLHGDRRTIDSNSNIVSVLSYDSGRVTQFLQRVGGVLTMVPAAEWPRGLSGAQAEPVRSPVFEVYTTTVARVGQPCPAFQATAVDGTSVNSADFSGSVVWVNLLAMSNAVCVLEARALAKDIMPRLAGKNIRLVVVMRDCAPEDAKRYAAETGLTCPVLPDPDRAIYRQFALGYVPRNVLIGPDGTILQHHTGYRLADLDTVASEALRLANR